MTIISFIVHIICIHIKSTVNCSPVLDPVPFENLYCETFSGVFASFFDPIAELGVDKVLLDFFFVWFFLFCSGLESNLSKGPAPRS